MTFQNEYTSKMKKKNGKGGQNKLLMLFLNAIHTQMEDMGMLEVREALKKVILEEKFVCSKSFY